MAFGPSSRPLQRPPSCPGDPPNPPWRRPLQLSSSDLGRGRPPTISTRPLSPGLDISRHRLSVVWDHYSWSMSWRGRVCVTAIGTYYLRQDRCPKNFCQVLAGWGRRVNNVQYTPFAWEHHHTKEVEG